LQIAPRRFRRQAVIDRLFRVTGREPVTGQVSAIVRALRIAPTLVTGRALAIVLGSLIVLVSATAQEQATDRSSVAEIAPAVATVRSLVAGTQSSTDREETTTSSTSTIIVPAGG
jgi:hypothetical protein